MAGPRASKPAFLLGGAPLKSARATYNCLLSAAIPHSMPPSAPPLPTLLRQTVLPLSSGSIPNATPDFWPARMMSLPFGSLNRIGNDIILAGQKRSEEHTSQLQSP